MCVVRTESAFDASKVATYRGQKKYGLFQVVYPF